MDVINKIISDISDKDFTPPPHICVNRDDCICEREISYKMKKRVFNKYSEEIKEIFKAMKVLNCTVQKRKEIEWYADDTQNKYRQINETEDCIHKKIKSANKTKYQNKEYSFIKKTSTEEKLDYAIFKANISPSDYWVHSINYHNDTFRFRLKFEKENDNETPTSLDIEFEIDDELTAEEIKTQFIDNLNLFIVKLEKSCSQDKLE